MDGKFFFFLAAQGEYSSIPKRGLLQPTRVVPRKPQFRPWKGKLWFFVSWNRKEGCWKSAVAGKRRGLKNKKYNDDQ